MQQQCPVEGVAEPCTGLREHTERAPKPSQARTAGSGEVRLETRAAPPCLGWCTGRPARLRLCHAQK